MSAPDPKQNERMEKIVSLCKRRGFIFQSSEIYGGFNGGWDYGPLGVELKRNLKDFWWRRMTRERDDIVGLDASILMRREVWKASGHVDTFNDPMVDCYVTKARFRADQVPEMTGTVLHFFGAIGQRMIAQIAHEAGVPIETLNERGFLTELAKSASNGQVHELFHRFFDEILREQNPNDSYRPQKVAAAATESQMALLHRPFSVLILPNKHPQSAREVAKMFYGEAIQDDPVLLGEQQMQLERTRRYNPANGSLLTEPREFNLMMKSNAGPIESEDNVVYLRPETAQGIFVNFRNVLDTSRKKLPFGIAQIGKAFRNEINPRNYTFRSREFEQMELEYFCRPHEGQELLEYWKEERLKFYEDIGLSRENLHVYTVPAADLAHYSKGTYDIEYRFPFGVQELEGVAYRTDFDLKTHQEHSGKPLDYFDDETQTRFIPHVVEPSAGVDRTVLALICEAYAEESLTDAKGNPDTREVLRFHPRMAPVKCGVFPLLKNKPELVAKAKEVLALLRPEITVFYDETGAIGKRYRRQDEIGTPFCVTIDFDTLGEKGPEQKDTVTLRHRDSMQQERVPIAGLAERLRRAVT